ncbi:MAG: hypothetical protein PHC94_13530, partial [Methylobacter sp.]|nr:hypothetical protein [Methylobacter sp.]
QVMTSSIDNKTPEQLVHELLLLSPNLSEEYNSSWVKEKYSQYRLCSNAELSQLYEAYNSQHARDLGQIPETHYESAIKQSICPFCQSAKLEKIDFYLLWHATHPALNLHQATVCSRCCRVFNFEDIALFPA